jgi:Rrf2 family transcriptional regulator, iron-sulfur cluster assembly transcription factor
VKFNQSVVYAIAAVVQIAADASGKPLSNAAICERTGMPTRFLLQILRHLVNGGVVTSERGVFGGYRLAKPASEITILDIYEAVDSIADDVDMHLDALAPASRRSLTATLDEIVADARKRLTSITVADLKATKK